MLPDMMRQVRENIENYGQHLFYVGGDGADPAFCYTIGNAEHGLPELLVIGSFGFWLTGQILNELGAKMREAGKPYEEGLLDIGWTYPFKIRKTSGDVNERFTIQAGRYLGHENYVVLQIMICDPMGRYPGDEGCDPDFAVERP
ncbi:MAG: DUF4262 domain-containing protein [Stutzerimonas stutzeri]|nr:MAG: DUF4262 domain-containing protein [Stutzerimonas stutzeri]